MNKDRYLRDDQGRECVTIGAAGKAKGVSKEAIRQAIKRGAIEVTVMNPHLHLIPLLSLQTYTPSPTHLRKPRGGKGRSRQR